MILVVGGTGSLGRATVQRFLAKGIDVRVMTRTPERAADLQEMGAEIVPGNLLDRASLVQACRGAEKVLASAHSIMGRGREASKYVDLRGHMDLIDVAKVEGVEHFVYTSAYYFNPEYDSTEFFQIKREIEHYLQLSGLNYTILRPTAFMETHAEMLIGRPILEKGKVSLFGQGENPRNFISADDVAKIAVMALEDTNLIGQMIDIGGPENLTNMDVVRLYEKLGGRQVKASHVPLAAIKIISRVIRPFNPALSMVMRSSIYADTTDCTFDAEPMLAVYPVSLTRLEDWAAQRIEPGASSSKHVLA